MWEVLEGALKSKIEIQWSDIEAIRAIIRDDEPGILEIRVSDYTSMKFLPTLSRIEGHSSFCVFLMGNFY